MIKKQMLLQQMTMLLRLIRSKRNILYSLDIQEWMR